MQTNPPSETTTKNATIAKLEECLRIELSAVETYELALKSINHVGIHHTFQEILDSHARRTEMLSEEIGRRGVDPPKSAGIWGAFAKAVQAGADLVGDSTAIAALEESEERGLMLYAEGLGDCDPRTRRFVEMEFLPEQRRTHELCRTMKEYIDAPS
jgi:demethoxyubiquinone hydroxylase (CLK1/Coq7/Cat5 family)